MRTKYVWMFLIVVFLLVGCQTVASTPPATPTQIPSSPEVFKGDEIVTPQGQSLGILEGYQPLEGVVTLSGVDYTAAELEEDYGLRIMSAGGAFDTFSLTIGWLPLE